MRYVAFVRGINVGGNKLVRMADLRAMAESMGLQAPQTLLNSGNLTFEAKGKDTKVLERTLAAEAEKSLDATLQFFVRAHDELLEAVRQNPFPDEADSDPGHLIVFFMRERLDASRVEDLKKAIVGREKVASAGRHLYAYYPDGVGKSKMAHGLVERKLGQQGTGRNWNTVRKLAGG